MTDKETAPGEITIGLKSWHGGNSEALERVIESAFKDLQHMAKNYMKKERRDHTLGQDGKGLLNEAWIKLNSSQPQEFANRKHFFGYMRTIMKRSLIDHSNNRNAQKRAGQKEHFSLDEAQDIIDQSAPDECFKLKDAITHACQDDPNDFPIFLSLFVHGQTNQETATLFNIPLTTVKKKKIIYKRRIQNYLGDISLEQ